MIPVQFPVEQVPWTQFISPLLWGRSTVLRMVGSKKFVRPITEVKQHWAWLVLRR